MQRNRILPEGSPVWQPSGFFVKSGINMKFSRINETTINCYLSQEDLASSGIDLDDIMERKSNAMEYLHRVILEAAREENFRLDGGVTTMQIRAMMDGSLSLTLSCQDPGEMAGSTADPAGAARSDGSDAGVFLNGTQDASGAPASGNVEAAMEAAGPAGSSAQDSMNRKVAEALNPPRKKKGGCFCYSFASLSDVITCCRNIPESASLNTSLWQNRENGDYYLLVSSAGDEVKFEKTILAMNEFGVFSDAPTEMIAYIREHEKCILKENAAAQLVRL